MDLVIAISVEGAVIKLRDCLTRHWFSTVHGFVQEVCSIKFL